MGKKKVETKGIVQVYTDGAYDHNRKIGGYGAVMFMVKNGETVLKKFYSETSFSETTSNRMEIRAILACLKKISTGYTIDIYSDSTYCVNGVCKAVIQYCPTYKANPDLWQELMKELDRHKKKGSRISAHWVRSHSGNVYNELADTLAYKGTNRPTSVSCGRKKKRVYE